MPYKCVFITETDNERECWHEAGHAVVAHHLGMTVLALGYSWVAGLRGDPNPSSWIPTHGFDDETIAVELGAGIAAEVFKLGNYNALALAHDFRIWKARNCLLPTYDECVDKAIRILHERDAAFVRVHERLLKERTTPSYPKFQDTDQMWKQQHLTREDFEALM